MCSVRSSIGMTVGIREVGEHGYPDQSMMVIASDSTKPI